MILELLKLLCHDQAMLLLLDFINTEIASDQQLDIDKCTLRKCIRKVYKEVPFGMLNEIQI